MNQEQLQQLQQLDQMKNQGYQMSQQQIDLYNYLFGLYTQMQQQQRQMPQMQQPQFQPQNRSPYAQQSQQQPMYGAPQQQQGNYNGIHQPTMNGQRPPQAGCTSTEIPTSRFNSNNIDKPKYTPPNAPTVVQPTIEEARATEAAARTALEASLTPLDGYEFPPLCVPGKLAVKKQAGEYYIYEIKEESNMEYLEHTAIYRNGALFTTPNKVPVKDTVINVSDATLVSDSLPNLLLQLEFVVRDDLEASETIVIEGSIMEPLVVKKATTADTRTQVIDMFKDSKDMRHLAAMLLLMVESNEESIAQGYGRVNKHVTKLINLGFRNTVGTDISIDSFVDDIDELYDMIKTSEVYKVKNTYPRMLDDLHASIKADAVKAVDLVNELDSLDGENCGTMVIPKSYTLINSKNEDLAFELHSASKGLVQYIKEDTTPVLESLIKSVEHTFTFTASIILLTLTDGSICRIMKSKVSPNYTIEKM